MEKVAGWQTLPDCISLVVDLDHAVSISPDADYHGTGGGEGTRVVLRPLLWNWYSTYSRSRSILQSVHGGQKKALIQSLSESETLRLL